MSNAAMKRSAEGAPPSAATPESKLREQLDRELHNRLVDIAVDIGAGRSSTNPLVLKCAARLAQNMIGYARPLPSALNIASHDEGDVLITLFGMLERKVDLWVTDESGTFICIGVDRGQVQPEQILRIEDCWKIARWLLGTVD